MLNLISKSLLPVLKWGTVIVATAVVVISIQVSADGQADEPAVVAPTGKIEKAVLLSNPEQPWSPAAGFADLIEKVSPAVVHVSISGTPRGHGSFPQFDFPPGSPFEDFFEQFRDRQPRQQERSRPLGIGSGFIISEDGLVVTNHHVVKDADEIVVTLTDGDEYTAELIGSDDKTDLALLKLDDAKDMPYVAWGDADKSRVGDWVVAIGNPFGLGGSATTGIISARGRDINSGPYDDYIQVDAAINRGNSGGPLFNLRGEVIGINTAIYSPNGGSVGIGFSIPSTIAEGVITQLKDTGVVERGWIGVQIQPITDELAEGFGRDNDHGALVARVEEGEPAEKGGIKSGDIILKFDGRDVEEMRDLPRIVADTPVGKKAKVEVWRNGSRKTLTVKTERYPEDPAAVAQGRGRDDAEPEEVDALGAVLTELDDSFRSRFSVDEEIDGVGVRSVQRGGLAASNGLRAGDVLTSVDNQSVSKPDQVRDIINRARKDNRSKIVVLLQRSNGSRFIAFDLEEQ
ncbi:MAG: DegQ family serine endoprotease [Gammaproteobacteria bacterium]|nr:DegQ family serine endoprotease [Gammaproteobacteria bacterium]